MVNRSVIHTCITKPNLLLQMLLRQLGNQLGRKDRARWRRVVLRHGNGQPYFSGTDFWIVEPDGSSSETLRLLGLSFTGQNDGEHGHRDKGEVTEARRANSASS